MKITIEKKTDQLNYEDFLGGLTRTVTIVEVRKGSKEQQYDLLVEAWGDDATQWVGRRAALYGDPTIMFGNDRVGGIRVSHVSHIDKPVSVALTRTRGKRAQHTLQPLADPSPKQAAPEPTAEQVAAETDIQRLGVMWQQSGPERRQQIEVRVTELRAEDGGGE